MRVVALILLIGVFLRHDSYHAIAQMTGWTPAAIFYVAGGFWEATLCAVIALIVFAMRKSLWRAVILGAMGIGFIEGMEASVCRLFISDIHRVPQGADLCDFVTGLPIGSVVMGIYFLVLCWVLANEPTTA